jgi:hypothetical protein
MVLPQIHIFFEDHFLQGTVNDNFDKNIVQKTERENERS